MPRGGWRYIAQRLTGDGSTGDFLDFDVPISGVGITDNLSGHNALTGTIKPEFGRMLADDGSLLLEEYGTAIWAENGGEIRGGGILTHSDFDGPEWKLETTGFTGYAEGMPYTDSTFFVEADPLDIYRHVWEHLQGKPGGDLGLEVSTLKTGLKVGVELEQGEFDTQSGPLSFESGPVKLTWYQTHDLGDFLTKLASDTPFDWHERHWWDGDVIRHKVDLGYPRIGRRRDDLRFVIGENVSVSPSIAVAGEDYASEVLALGSGEGAAMVKGHSSRPTRRLRRVAVVADSSLLTAAATNSLAEREIAWRAITDSISGITCIDHPHARVGSVNVGDEIFIEGRIGWRTLETYARVTSISITPDQGNVMQLAVTRSDRLVA